MAEMALGMKNIEHTMFFKAISEVDTTRDYTIIVDRSASMKLKGRWKEAEAACQALCEATVKADADGMTLYFFSSHSKTSKGETPSFTKYEDITTGAEIMEQFTSKTNEPHGGTDLVTVLKDALPPPGSKPASILVITDGSPDDKDAVAVLIKDTANALKTPTDLFLTILQVGDDAKGDEYLIELDEGLDKLGCKIDIVDVLGHKALEEVNGKGFSFAKIIAEAIARGAKLAKDPDVPKLSEGIVSTPVKAPSPAKAEPAAKAEPPKPKPVEQPKAAAPAPAPKIAPKPKAPVGPYTVPTFSGGVAVKARPVSKRPQQPNKPGFSRFVEVGRVALINYGPLNGSICTIIDIVDQQRVLIDGPQSETGVCRQVIKTDRLMLTDIVVEGLSHGCKITKLQKAWKDQEIMNEWLATAWAAKLDKKRARAETSDFDRFKLMIAKKQRTKIVSAKL